MENEWCNEESKTELNLKCTLPKNHKGDHIATACGIPIEVWAKVKNKRMYRLNDKIKFKGEVQRYTVQACNDRYLICTKPFNLKKTVLYTIVDLENQIRGTEDLVFCKGFETRELCEEALKRIVSGQTEISYRNRVELNIENSEGKQ